MLSTQQRAKSIKRDTKLEAFADRSSDTPAFRCTIIQAPEELEQGSRAQVVGFGVSDGLWFGALFTLP